MFMGKQLIRSTAMASRFENRKVLFWGLSRNNIKLSSLYSRFVANDRRISFLKDNEIITFKNELLTQSHKDVLEALLLLRDVSSIRQTVCYSDILNTLEKKSRNCVWIYEILEELDNVNFDFSSADATEHNFFGIISNLCYDSKTGSVSFNWDVSFIAILNESDVFSYIKYTPLIANLKHDVSKQAVRWLLTFDNIQISLKKLIVSKLGFGNVVTPRSISRYLSYIKEEDLSMFGISIVNGVISINRSREDVSFFAGKDISLISDIVKKKKKKQLTLDLFDLN